ncbi:hypothetical protein A9W99_09095 [Mycobacterium sp. 1164966.3]|nr:hypothetical protein A9W99_09095 [Mycobacterium sp. 1164966.3]
MSTHGSERATGARCSRRNAALDSFLPRSLSEFLHAESIRQRAHCEDLPVEVIDTISAEASDGFDTY